MSEPDAAWGRVDETGTVYVRTPDGERPVGQYPGSTPEEALAYFTRKYAGLAGSVTLLEQRVRGGAAPADVARAVATLRESVRTAHAVGDFAALDARLERLATTTAELSEQHAQAHRTAVEASRTERTRIVEEIERLAAREPASIRWKQASTDLEALVTRWHEEQQRGPRVPKAEIDVLWKRLRAARNTLEQHRRAFYAELEVGYREVRAKKERLIERATALAGKGAVAIADYRTLMDEWRAAGRAGKKADDALWLQMKAAGDVLFAAKAEADAVVSSEQRENLEQKRALITEAEKLLNEKDPKRARTELNRIQDRWDRIGRVPRDQMTVIEDQVRKIERHVHGLETEQWRKNDPEKRARSDGMVGQLYEAIARLERELAEANAAGDTRAAGEAQEALDARRAWLRALGAE